MEYISNQTPLYEKGKFEGESSQWRLLIRTVQPTKTVIVDVCALYKASVSPGSVA